MPPLDRASWIWHSTADSVCHFRKVFTLTDSPRLADMLITADNGYELHINGSYVGGDIGAEAIFWQSVEYYDVKHLLVPGENVIGIRATRLGGHSGLLAAMRITPKSGRATEMVTDATWRVTDSSDPTGYTQAHYEETSDWQDAVVRGLMGVAPWGQLSFPGAVSPAGSRALAGKFTEPEGDFRWPDGVIFLRGRVPESSTPNSPQAIWRIGESRAYLEMDTIGPAMLGHSLWTLIPAQPGGNLHRLLDAGQGLIGSPSVSFDGDEIYFSMAPAGEKFFRVYRMPARGGAPQALTSGPFHDFDPEPLPDGRIVFSSTRMGSREEYHGNIGRALFVMNADGSGIHPITHHIVGDNEPRVTASGQIAFIRQDNFMERAKVETQIHVIRPDGAAGQVLLGPDRQAIPYSHAHAAENDTLWLRNYGFGSPAPLPDGRVAAISAYGLVISGTEVMPPATIRPAIELVDVSPLPDGRLLCTTAGLRAIGILDLDNGDIVRVFDQAPDAHSAVYLGPRPRPVLPRASVGPGVDDGFDATGFLLGQNVFYSKQTNAEMSRVKAIRVLQGNPFAVRAARHPYVHIGVEAVELGTVPLAPDGSFYVEVPADRALALQAVDAEGRSVINEMSWIYVRPGEQRSCIGCHSQREVAPPNDHGILALKAPPVPLLGKGRPHRFRGNNAANGGVLNLQFDRFREVASIDLHSLPSASGDLPSAIPNRSTQVQRLTRQLASNHPSARISALQRLAIFRDRSAASALAAALADTHYEVRLNAALALAACGTRESVQPLLAALHDPHPAVAQAAHMALANLTGRDEPFNAFTAPAARRPAVEAWHHWMAEYDWNVIEQKLIEQLGSADRAKVEDAVATLGHAGGDAAKAALRKFVATDAGEHLRATLAAIRALGHLQDEQAIDLLARVLNENIPRSTKPAAGHHEFGWTQRPVHLAGAAAEALGWIAASQPSSILDPRSSIEALLIEAYNKLEEFWYYTFQTGDHDWLMGCHSSIPHFRIAEALDAMDSRKLAAIVPKVLKSVPIDTDRGLLFENDDYEAVTARIVNRSGLASQVIEICLSMLGDEAGQPSRLPGGRFSASDAAALPTGRLDAAIAASPPARTCGPLDPESRAAQLLSIVCLEPDHAPRMVAALNRYRAGEPSRTRSWVCFYLSRALGRLRHPAAVDSLIAALEEDATEASFGLVDPPNVFLNNAMTPCYRAAAAYALGELGESRAAPTLLKIAADFDNAVDVRNAAAQGLLLLKDAKTLPQLKKLAADYPETATRRVLLEACAQSGESDSAVAQSIKR